jgi:triosephosphate isomerase
MSRTPFIAGNWKMNTDRASAEGLAKAVAAGAPAGAEVGVAPPFVYLETVGRALKGSNVLLGAQDAYFEANGAFTGEISVAMLKDLGVKFVLTGHSERRHVIGEKGDLIAKKAHAVYDGGLTLVHCVGETIEQRDAGTTFDVVRRQIEELSDRISDAGRLVIAYEPVWAIGTGRNATAEQAQEVHVFIRKTLGEMWNPAFAQGVRIQYGGSMKPENAGELLKQPDVDGGLIGGASLKSESFLKIVEAAL